MDESIPFHDQLLATKFFVPSSPHPLIARPQLTTLLNQGLRRKLTLIAAPAGFGKTTLLSTWVHSFPKENPDTPRVASLSLTHFRSAERSASQKPFCGKASSR